MASSAEYCRYVLTRRETSADEGQHTLNPKVQGSTPCASTNMFVLIRLRHDKSVPEDACQRFG
jgi:hypothetical protein